MRALHVRREGTLEYEAALALQHELVAMRQRGEGQDTLLLLEHPNVFTLGRRRTSEQNVLMPGDIPVVQVERGGDVTWHGPGQLVGYPILALEEEERDIHAVLRRLEDAMIAVLGRCGLQAGRREKFTGVWCQGRKLVSLGVAVREWVTFHGFAINVDCGLDGFARINPCGLESQVMGSVESLGGTVPSPDELMEWAAIEVAAAFERSLV
ncbi:MAG: octanoyltransferase [Deltaproteobacteria bacterium]|nr:octanoyltransferase [Deltaproteobacteria bacterium]